jgi:hypothetical protein
MLASSQNTVRFLRRLCTLPARCGASNLHDRSSTHSHPPPWLSDDEPKEEEPKEEEPKEEQGAKVIVMTIFGRSKRVRKLVDYADAPIDRSVKVPKFVRR